MVSRRRCCLWQRFQEGCGSSLSTGRAIPHSSRNPLRWRAGRFYYIEALQEQGTGSDNLSVAWQGPTVERSVIDGKFLVPWNENRVPTNRSASGILREYWTNFFLGDLAGFGGARVFGGVLTARGIQVHVQAQDRFPTPVPIALNQPLLPENNFEWVAVEGTV